MGATVCFLAVPPSPTSAFSLSHPWPFPYSHFNILAWCSLIPFSRSRFLSASLDINAEFDVFTGPGIQALLLRSLKDTVSRVPLATDFGLLCVGASPPLQSHSIASHEVVLPLAGQPRSALALDHALRSFRCFVVIPAFLLVVVTMVCPTFASPC